MSNYAAATSKAQTRCTAAGAAAGALGHGAFASANSSCGSAADGNSLVSKSRKTVLQIFSYGPLRALALFD